MYLKTLLFAAIVLGSVTAAVANEPTRKWYTIDTDHFRIHYYNSIRHSEAQVAQRVARCAERAHALLAPTLRSTPSTPTHIVVTDDVDSPNGFANVVPFDAIRVFVTAPESRSTLNDYDDWLQLLILHEYVHILHLDTIHGLPRLVNAVMGKIWAPNQIQPRWFIEGLAVYYESHFTSAGRNRSSIFDMYLRAALLEGKLLDLDQVSSGTRVFPRGTVPYLYGSRFLKYLADRFGDDKLISIGHRYGGQPIPYSLNRMAIEAFGADYVSLYHDFRQYLRQRYELQRAEAAARGLTAYDEVTKHGWTVLSPRYTPDGRQLVYIASDGDSHAAMRIIDVRSGKLVEQHDHLGGETVGFSPDGAYLVYGQLANWRTFHSYHDLYVKRRSTGQVRRLTRGLRAREPDVSPDGRWVAFVTNELGNNDLRLVAFEGGTSRLLRSGKDHEQFYTPRWSPDGRKLVVSRWLAGQRDLVEVDVSSGTLRPLTSDRAIDMDPQFSSDGKRVYFSSDRTGIFNIYCYHLEDGSIEQVSNVIGGAFAPAVSPREDYAYYVGFSSRGYDLHGMQLKAERFLPALPFVDDRPPLTEINSAPSESPLPVRRYSPWRSIYPRSWSFSVGTDAFGTSVGVEVSGTDAVGDHSWLLSTATSTAEGYLSYLASYKYTGWWPDVSVRTSRRVGLRGGLSLDGEQQKYVEENYGVGTSVSMPVLRIPDHSLSMSMGYGLNWLGEADKTRTVVLPGMLSPTLPETGRLASLNLTLAYSSVNRFAESISPESGRRLRLALRVDNKALGGQFTSTQLTWSWAEYVDLPWLDRHVLALHYSGGIAGGDFKRRGYFFLGGFSEQDVLQAIIEQLPMGGVYLRGYDPGSVFGDQYHLLKAEYRFPLFSVERGLSTLPLYVNHVHMAAFTDVGNAFFGDFKFEDIKVGVGGEVLTDWVIGYVVPLTLRLGYARGLMDGGGSHFFFLLGNRF